MPRGESCGFAVLKKEVSNFAGLTGNAIMRTIFGDGQGVHQRLNVLIWSSLLSDKLR